MVESARHSRKHTKTYAVAILLTLASTNFTCKRRRQLTETVSTVQSMGFPLELCVALRGNGPYVPSHFGALARILEHYGHIDALSGGGSAALSMFLYESIRMNPAVSIASTQDRPIRMALLFKSLLGFMDHLKDLHQVTSIRHGINLLEQPQVKEALDLPIDQWAEAAGKLLSTFKEDRFLSLINPKVIAMLENKDDLGYVSHEFKVREVVNALRQMQSSSVTDQKIVFREGIFDFTAISKSVGFVADFYAGREPKSQNLLDNFVERCASKEISSGKTWGEIQATTSGKTTCGALFEAAIKTYQSNTAEKPTTVMAHRIDETMGLRIPMFVATAVFEGKAALDQIDAARSRYLSGSEPKLEFGFSDVHFGYWLPYSYANLTVSEMAKNVDAKSRKFKNLGSNVTWQYALERSLAVTGWSRPVINSESQISLGGWSDLQPVQVLKAAGCKEIAYVTRRGEEDIYLAGSTPIGSRPPQGVLEHLGLKEEDRIDLYDLKNGNSGFSAALSQTQSVWCTDWNRFKASETESLFVDGYRSEILARNEFFKNVAPESHTNIVAGPIAGCGP